MPKIGSVVAINGNKAQCIAHATEVEMPKKSQFNLILIIKLSITKIVNLQH